MCACTHTQNPSHPTVMRITENISRIGRRIKFTRIYSYCWLSNGSLSFTIDFAMTLIPLGLFLKCFLTQFKYISPYII